MCLVVEFEDRPFVQSCQDSNKCCVVYDVRRSVGVRIEFRLPVGIERVVVSSDSINQTNAGRASELGV
jgi:hypothetical protein